MDWPHDDTASLIAFYGNPDKPSFAGNLLLVTPPFQMWFGEQQVKGVTIHKKCAASLMAVFDSLWEHYGHDQKKVDDSGLSSFSGSYNNRSIRGSSRKSCHAFGAAIDIDAEDNAMHTAGSMDPAIIAAFKAQGWFWGGDFHSRTDPMHFQAAYEARPTHSKVEVKPPPPKPLVAKIDPPQTQAEPPESPLPEFLQSKEEPAEKELPKPLTHSKIATAQVAVGAGGVVAAGGVLSDAVTEAGQAVVNNPELAQQFGLVDIFQHLVYKPGFWLALAVIVIASLTIYWRWKDHGRGKV